jgi:hypothetical protein
MHLLIPLLAFAISVLAMDPDEGYEYNIDGYGLTCHDPVNLGANGKIIKFVGTVKPDDCADIISGMRKWEKPDALIRFTTNNVHSPGYILRENRTQGSCTIMLSFNAPEHREDHFSFRQLSDLLSAILDRCTEYKKGGIVQFGLEKKMVAVIQPGIVEVVNPSQSDTRSSPSTTLPPPPAKSPPSRKHQKHKLPTKPRAPR